MISCTLFPFVIGIMNVIAMCFINGVKETNSSPSPESNSRNVIDIFVATNNGVILKDFSIKYI